jgi:hypothetical protein
LASIERQAVRPEGPEPVFRKLRDDRRRRGGLRLDPPAIDLETEHGLVFRFVIAL